MEKVSYAERFEDALIFNVFKNVKNGYYIDVGAADPTINSVTKLLSQNGWRGINIEPNYKNYKALKRDRKKDINLRVLIGQKEGEVKFYEIVGISELSTINSEIAKQWEKKRSKLRFLKKWRVRESTMKIKTLDKVCHENNVDVIHVLKIDVEGSERLVIEGMKFEKYRPWLIVIESVEPIGGSPCFQSWENILISKKYAFTFTDQVNRYYIAEEHIKLKSSFSEINTTFYKTYTQYESKSIINSIKKNAKKLLILINKSK
jgi:FkbM family methyltransferase